MISRSAQFTAFLVIYLAFNVAWGYGCFNRPVTSLISRRLSAPVSVHSKSCRIRMTLDGGDKDEKISEEPTDDASVQPATEAAQKNKGPKIFGLSLTDPQDILSLFLYGVIIYNGVDLLIYFVRKLTGNLSE